ncbi:MAG: DUF4252 domain-containing protein [Aureispira sp.]|nr:DUF4252 domain-containing protein [Aureispira sp.]
MRLLLILISLCWSIGLFGQTAKLNKFYAKYKARPNTTNIALPGWIVRFGAGIAAGKAEEIRTFKPLLKGLRGMRILVSEGENYSSTTEVKAVVQDAKKHHFKDLVFVRDGSTRVNLMFRDKQRKQKAIVKNVLVLVSEEDELVMVSFKGRWKMKTLNKMMQQVKLGGDLNFFGSNSKTDKSATEQEKI